MLEYFKRKQLSVHHLFSSEGGDLGPNPAPPTKMRLYPARGQN